MQQHGHAEFWRDRRVFLTGHTGFKGAWLHSWLRALGADVTGFALAPPDEPNLWDIVGAGARSIIADIRDEARVRAVIMQVQPQIVIHMAAQALVRESYRDPLGTYGTNVMGTANVLQACRNVAGLQCVVVVTSDKVYENHGGGQPFVEGDRLGGHDPYSNSKACAELLTAAFRDSYFGTGPPIASVRAGNVIGGGDWARDRLVPDLMRAFSAGEQPVIRFPAAIRPWQHVLEPLSGYLHLAERLHGGAASVADGWNFGPAEDDAKPVRWIADTLSSLWGEGAGWDLSGEPQPHEAHYLRLDCAKAERELGWRPAWPLEEGLRRTVEWYKANAGGQDMRAFSRQQIELYQSSRKQISLFS